MFVLVCLGFGTVKTAAVLFKYFLHWQLDMQVPVAPLIFCYSTGAAVLSGQRQIGRWHWSPGAKQLTRLKRGGISKVVSSVTSSTFLPQLLNWTKQRRC